MCVCLCRRASILPSVVVSRSVHDAGMHTLRNMRLGRVGDVSEPRPTQTEVIKINNFLVFLKEFKKMCFWF